MGSTEDRIIESHRFDSARAGTDNPRDCAISWAHAFLAPKAAPNTSSPPRRRHRARSSPIQSGGENADSSPKKRLVHDSARGEADREPAPATPFPPACARRLFQIVDVPAELGEAPNKRRRLCIVGPMPARQVPGRDANKVRVLLHSHLLWTVVFPIIQCRSRRIGEDTTCDFDPDSAIPDEIVDIHLAVGEVFFPLAKLALARVRCQRGIVKTALRACELGCVRLTGIVMSESFCRPSNILFSEEMFHDAVCAACAHGQTEMLHFLCDRFITKLGKIQFPAERAFAAACSSGSVDTLRAVEKMAPHMMRFSEHSPDMRASFCIGLLCACNNGHVSVASALIRTLPEVGALGDRMHRLALEVACCEGHLDVAKLVLERMCDTAASRNSLSMTALSSATKRGHTNIVQFLVDAFDMDVGDFQNVSSTFAAATEDSTNASLPDYGSLPLLEWIVDRFWTRHATGRRAYEPEENAERRDIFWNFLRPWVRNSTDPAVLKRVVDIAMCIYENHSTEMEQVRMRSKLVATLMNCCNAGCLDLADRLYEIMPRPHIFLPNETGLDILLTSATSGNQEMVMWVLNKMPFTYPESIAPAMRVAAIAGHVAVLKAIIKHLNLKAPDLSCLFPGTEPQNDIRENAAITLESGRRFLPQDRRCVIFCTAILRLATDSTSGLVGTIDLSMSDDARLAGAQWYGKFQRYKFPLECCVSDMRDLKSLCMLPYMPKFIPLVLWHPTYASVFGHACAYGHLDIVQWMVSEFGTAALGTAPDERGSSFGFACANGHLDVAKWMHAHLGITKEDAGWGNGLALYLSSANGREEVVRWLKSTFGFGTADVARAAEIYLPALRSVLGDDMTVVETE